MQKYKVCLVQLKVSMQFRRLVITFALAKAFDENRLLDALLYIHVLDIIEMLAELT